MNYRDIGGGGYGQNIGYGVSATRMISDGFYNGEVRAFRNEYGKSQPGGDFHAWGHFTQLVWKGTKRIGCATVNCKMGPYTVCNYGPPGKSGVLLSIILQIILQHSFSR